MDQDQVKELRELIELLKASEIAEFDMEQPDFKVRLKFAAAVPAVANDFDQTMRLAPQVSLEELRDEVLEASLRGKSPRISASDPTHDETLHTVKSPIVGTFYESPSPGTPAFIKVGDEVEVGQVLCIIEAMKLMNEIEAEVAGEVVKRIAASGQPVEYGQPLFTIRPR